MSCSSKSQTNISQNNTQQNIDSNIINKANSKLNNIPLWYTDNSYTDSDTFLYGFGEANTLDKATDNAIGNILQRLESTISTQSNIQTSIQQNNISKNISFSTKSSSAKVIIKDFNIIQKQYSNNRYYVLVEINKPKLINSLQKNIVDKFVLLDNQLALKNSIIDIFKIAEEANHNLEYIKRAIYTIYILDNRINLESYSKEYNLYNKKLNNLKKDIKITVNDNQSNFFYTPLKEYLHKNYILTKNINNANIEITLKNKSFDESGSFDSVYKINAIINLQVKDIYSDILIEKDFKIDASSNYGRQRTIEEARQIFYNKLVNSKSIIY